MAQPAAPIALNAALRLAHGPALPDGQPVRRTLDPTSINAAANHPDVRPWLGELQMGALDFAPLVTDPRNVTMANDCGGFIGHNLGAGRYEVHSLFVPEGRGRLRAETARGLTYLFTATDCASVVTKVPACNPRAAVLARQSGFVELFARPDAWEAPNGERCPVSFQEVTLARWIDTAPDLLAAGERAAALFGLNAKDQDAFALRSLGALSAMLTAGSGDKAVWTYGTRAAFGGLPPLALLSNRPHVVTINGTTLQAVSGKLEPV